MLNKFRSRRFRSKVTAVYHCTLNCTMFTVINDDVTCVQWSIYLISYDPVSFNQMTRIYIGVT